LNSLKLIVDEKVREHNKLVKERTSEQKTWIENVWSYFYKETEPEYRHFKTKTMSLERREKGLKRTLKNAYREIQEYELQIKSLKNKMYGIESTVEAINNQLKMYGFNNFFLTEAEDNKYKIV